MSFPRYSIQAALASLALLVGLLTPAGTGRADAQTVPSDWAAEWPSTDFSRSAVPFSEILSGGPPKDGIPPIDTPAFIRIAAETDLAPTEPVISVDIDGGNTT